MRKAAIGLGIVALLGVAAVAVRQGRPPVAAPWSDRWILDEGQRFLDDTAYRRQALERSLVNPANRYSQERLTAYALGDQGWDLLPAWNARSVPVDAALAARLAQGESLALPEGQAPLWDGVRPQTMEGWVALGRRVFFEYPMRADAFLEFALARPDLGREVGVERTAAGDVPGLVLFANVDRQTRVGITCALCHASVKDGVVVAGRARRRFDYGRLRVAYFAETGEPVEDELVARMKRWGPGRADVTEDDDEDPVTIPDLWGLRSMRWLTQAGTIRQESPLALAIRQETQLTGSNHFLVRPPRELAWALALYVYSLAPPARARPASPRGAALFARTCEGCHANEAHGGRPLPAAAVGTHAALARGHGRGTGLYRVPPLLDVGEGAPYLHDGSVASLKALLSPARLQPDYAGGTLGPGAVPGHEYGTDLSAEDRAALISFLETL